MNTDEDLPLPPKWKRAGYWVVHNLDVVFAHLVVLIMVVGGIWLLTLWEHGIIVFLIIGIGMLIVLLGWALARLESFWSGSKKRCPSCGKYRKVRRY